MKAVTWRAQAAAVLLMLLLQGLSACSYDAGGTVLVNTAVPSEEPAQVSSTAAVVPTTEPTPIAPAETAEPTAEPSTTAPPPTAAPTTEPSATTQPAAPAAEFEVETIVDVPYVMAEAEGAVDRNLDIYYAPQAEQRKPVIIWAHGTNFDKSSGRIFGRLLARAGYVVLAIDWSDEVTNDRQADSMRAAMEDVQCALRFAATTAQYGADAQQVIWAGYSAGAWIGSLLAFGDGDLQEAFDTYAARNGGPPQQVRCTAEADAARITAYVPSAGAYPGDFWFGDGVMKEWTAVLAPVQDYAAVGHNKDLRVRILHGKIDFAHTSAFDNAQTFAQALDAAGYDVQFLPQDGAHDSFQLQAIEQIKALAP